MGGFFSSLIGGGGGGVEPSAAGDDPDSRVVSLHKIAAYNLHMAGLKETAQLVVIYFSASWCGPCRFIQPAFKAMASKFTDVAFVKIDVDELKEVAGEWKVDAMPTFVLAKRGKEVTRVVGANKDELEKNITAHRLS